MPLNANLAVLDFSPLADIGKTIAGGLSKKWQNQAVQSALDSAKNPDGSYNYDKAIMNLQRVGANDEAAIMSRYALAKSEQEATNAYRKESLKPDMQRLYEWAYPSQGGAPAATAPAASVEQPSRLGPDGRPTPQDFVSSQLMSKTLTPAEKAVDEKFAKDYADWYASGGYSGVQKQKEQLQNGITALDKADNISGPGIGILTDIAGSGGITGGIAGGAQSYFLPQSINVRQQIEQAIQQSLRQVLGSQYTQIEGENLLKRTFDPRLDEKVNAQRAQMVLDQLDAAAKAKDDAARYYEQNRTLKGWQGHLLSSGSEIQTPGGESGKMQDRLSPYDAGQEAPPPSAPAQATVGDAGKNQREGPGAAPPIPETADKNKLIAAYKRFKDADPQTLKLVMDKFDSLYGYPGLASELLGELRAGR